MNKYENMSEQTDVIVPEKIKHKLLKKIILCIFSAFALLLLILIIAVIIDNAKTGGYETSGNTEYTTSIYDAPLYFQHDEDNTVDVDVLPVNITLSDNALFDFEAYIDSVDVNYDFEHGYNIDKALNICNSNTVNSVTEHNHDVRINGKFNAEHLYEIVKKNNKEYLENTFGYEEYSKKTLKKLCQQICDALTEITEKDSTIDVDMISCYLYNLKILDRIVALDFAAITMDGVFYMNYDYMETAGFAMDSDNIKLTTFYHEMMHVCQMACDDVKAKNETRFGLCHMYDELNVNPLSFYWLAEASAEMNMSRQLGVRYSTYKSMITYVESLNFIANINSVNDLIKIENLSFNKEIDRLFSALDMTSDEEIRELLKMTFSIEIIQHSDSSFYDWYLEEYGIDLDVDSNGEETYIRLTVKEDALLTMTKIFYRNLARMVNTGNATLQDIYFLMRIMEADLDRHMSNNTVGYMLFFNNFYYDYIEIQDEFLHTLASENNLNFEMIVSDFESYSISNTAKSPNCDLAFLSTEKKKYIADYFVNSFYKTDYPSMRECASTVEDLSKTISIEEMVSNRALG